MFENLLPCVLLLRVFAFSYIMTASLLVESSSSVSQETQIHRTKHVKILLSLKWDFMLFS